MTEKPKYPQKKQSKYCINCDYTGIVHNSLFAQAGEKPLTPCPKCVGITCKCGGKEPYYYSDKGIIKECPCREISLKIDRIMSLYANSGIDKHYKWRFISDFQVRNKSTEDAKKAAYEIIKNFPNTDKGLFLWGAPGTGKTLLSTIILTELLIKKAVDGRYAKISRTFFNRLRASFNESSPTYGSAESIERELATIDILVIDDFGVQRDSEWEIETLYNLVDARYEALKFTIFTSNLDPFKSMKDKSEGRILSRIKEMCRIMEITGSDYRDKL